MSRGCFASAHMSALAQVDGRARAQRAIATLHSFRFFGLVFILPGVVSPDLPAGFAVFAAYGDFATGVLAMLALLTVRIRPLFWLFVVAFNLVGTVDLVVDYYHAIQVGLPAHAEGLGATYAIPIIYVPLLMITHVAAFYFLARPSARRRCRGTGRRGLRRTAKVVVPSDRGLALPTNRRLPRAAVGA